MWQISHLEQDTRLDGAVSAGQRVARFIRPGKVRNVLHGVWLGHPLHPMLIQATIGTWLSASILDFAGGDQKAARRLVTAGLAVAVPAAPAGAADWSEQHEQQMRVGVVHAAGTIAAAGPDGELADGCLTCPWHGSMFRLTDGSVAQGPATAPHSAPGSPSATRTVVAAVRPYPQRSAQNRCSVRYGTAMPCRSSRTPILTT